jgi:uncharacterized protein (TIGR00369 family)
MPGGLQVPPNCDLTLGLVCVEKKVAGTTRWRTESDERFCNPAGILQGGFLAAICDSAMGASAVTFATGRKVFARNAEMKVSFLAPVSPGRLLECVARVLSGGDRTAFLEAELSDIGPASQLATEPEVPRLVVKASSTYLYAERRSGP